jgi:hypothetical protein
MKKSEGLFPHVIIVSIRFFLGIVLGIILFGLVPLRTLMLSWLGDTSDLVDLIIIFIILLMGIGTAIWGDKVLNLFIDIFFRRR